MAGEFVPGVRAPAKPAGDAHAYAFRGRRLLVVLGDDGAARVPTLADVERAAAVSPALTPLRRQYLGSLDERPVLSLEVPESAEAPDGMAFEGLRSLFARLAEPEIWIAGRAVQIVQWDRDHQFCGRCGTATENLGGERSRKCPHCGLSAYPRLSPAVIVLVERGGDVLLARSPHFPSGMYSTLAGFVEPGESLEETVAREIEEEVGVRVENVRYFGSQPWPFPNSLMIGFRAEHAGGEIRVDGIEIDDAGWFGVDGLPRIPPRISIARAMIEAWRAERADGAAGR